MATAEYTPTESLAVACLGVAREAVTERRYCIERRRELREDYDRVSAISKDSKYNVELRALAFARLSDATRDLGAAIARYWTVIRFADDCISRIPDGRFRLILRLRYLSGLPWQQVKEELRKFSYYYEEAQMRRMHKAALRALAEEIARASEAMGIGGGADHKKEE